MSKYWYLVISNALIYLLTILGLIGLRINQLQFVFLFILFLMMMLLISTTYFINSDTNSSYQKYKYLYRSDFFIRLTGITLIFYGFTYLDDGSLGFSLLILASIFLMINALIENKILKNEKYIENKEELNGDNRHYFNKLLHNEATDGFKTALSYRLSVMGWSIVIIVFLSSISFNLTNNVSLIIISLRVTIGFYALTKLKFAIDKLYSQAKRHSPSVHLISCIFIGVLLTNVIFGIFDDSMTSTMILVIFVYPTEHLTRKLFLNIKRQEMN